MSNLINSIVNAAAEAGLAALNQFGASMLGQAGYNNAPALHIPAMNTPGYRMMVSHAKDIIKHAGLKPVQVLAAPDMKFKDCVNQEIVGTDYDPNIRYVHGQVVHIWYVNEHVIMESQRLYAQMHAPHLHPETRSLPPLSPVHHGHDVPHPAINHTQPPHTPMNHGVIGGMEPQNHDPHYDQMHHEPPPHHNERQPHAPLNKNQRGNTRHNAR